MMLFYAILALLSFSGLAAAAEDRATAFVEKARTGTEKYRDQNLAILDGYRRIGRDFPGMGEHWIAVGLLFDGKIEPERPEFLIYLKVSGKPELLGAAYALPLLPGEASPDFPAGKEAWHDHYRSIEDETTLPHHNTSGAAGREPRLAMLHAWIWKDNPSGIFAADNWAIPYLRLGIAPPNAVPLPEALALSLLNGGAEYYLASIEAAALPNLKQLSAIEKAFQRTKSAVASRVQTRQMDQLGKLWHELVKSLESPAHANAAVHLHHMLR